MAQQATEVGPGAATSAPSDVLVRIRAMLPGMSAAEARIGRILPGRHRPRPRR